MYTPHVYYLCPCSKAPALVDYQAELKQNDKAALSVIDKTYLVSDRIAIAKLPLSHLYYCDDCGEIKCQKCVYIEPAVYHCPNCLFEVPSTSVRAENNRCGRNCYECPTCTQILTVVEGTSGHSLSAEIRSGDVLPEKTYWMQCSVCAWDSREIGWEFARPSGISSQIKEIQRLDIQQKEFDNLVSHFEKLKNFYSKAGENPEERDAIGYLKRQKTSDYRRSSRLFGSDLTKQMSALHDITRNETESSWNLAELAHTYKTELYKAEDPNIVGTIAHLSSGNADYMRIDNLQKYPQKKLLSMKTSKRCRKSRHILTKPENKAQSTKFKIKLMASNFVPNISIPVNFGPQMPILPGNNPGHLISLSRTLLPVRFFNPLYTEMTIKLKSHSDQVNFLPNKFNLRAFIELWEYDDDEDNDNDLQDDFELEFGFGPDADGFLESQSSFEDLQRTFDEKKFESGGVLSRRGNTALVLLELNPSKPTKDFVAPVTIEYSYITSDDTSDEESSKGTQNHPDSSNVVLKSILVFLNLGTVV